MSYVMAILFIILISISINPDTFSTKSLAQESRSNLSGTDKNHRLPDPNDANVSKSIQSSSTRALVPITKTLTLSSNISAHHAAPSVELRKKLLGSEAYEKFLEKVNPPTANIGRHELHHLASASQNKTVKGPQKGSQTNIVDANVQAVKPVTTNNSISTLSALPSHAPLRNFRLYSNHSIDSIGRDALFMRNEPDVSNNGNIIFYVGTFYAGISRDSGRSWSYVDLLSELPATCCDQEVVYDSRNHMFIWSMMNLPYNGSSPELGQTNNLTLGVSSDAHIWRFYTINSTLLNQTWTNNVFDYPQLTLSERYVYMSVNRFSNWQDDNHTFEGPIILRIPRDMLARGSNVRIDFMGTSPPVEGFAPVQGARNIMYWASHLGESASNTIRIYKWNDNSLSINWLDRIIDNWNDSDSFQCPTPDGHNWCNVSDTRITSGWIMDGNIGFLWNVPSGDGFPYTYVNGATFTLPSLTYIGRPYLWSDHLDIAYARAYPLNHKLGITAAFGDSSHIYPSIAAGIGYSSHNGGVIWDMHSIAKGTNGPEDNTWGDYFSVKPYPGVSSLWFGTGFILHGGSSQEYIKPYYFVFGTTNAR